MFPSGRILVERFELVHPLIQGNKWYKLKYNLINCVNEGKDTILSFGGAYSNHIHALAAAGKMAGIDTIGVIRGDVPVEPNHTLRDALEFGMRLHFVSRSEYRKRYSEEYIAELQGIFGDFYFVPEGGSNKTGYLGAAEMLPEDAGDFSRIFMATGSGGTVGGNLIAASRMGLSETGIVSIPVLKDFNYVIDEVKNILKTEGVNSFDRLEVLPGWHHGGYAKITDELIDFIREFQALYKIPLDPVYTGKVLFAVSKLSQSGEIKPDERVLVYHTGGLQGMSGFLERFPRFSFLAHDRMTA